MRRLLCLIVLLALPGLAGAQEWIRYYPATGFASGGTITGVINAPNGSAGAPSYSFSTATNVGIYYEAGPLLSFSVGGSRKLYLSTTILTVPTGMDLAGGGPYLNWQAGDAQSVVTHGLPAATATAQTIKAANSTGATIAGPSLTLKGGAGTSGIANGGALILAGGDKSSTGEPGAVAIADGGTKPTCDAARRGSIWYDAGGAGVADTFEVCAKAAAGDAYAWRILATIP